MQSYEQPFRLIVFGFNSVRTIPLDGTRWTIGRGEDCDIVLKDPSVSRRHLALERQGEEFRVRDLGGRNPVLLEGRPVREGRLLPGQTLLVGMTRLTLDVRSARMQVLAESGQTAIVSREVLDEEAAQNHRPTLDASSVASMLEAFELPLADLGSFADVAEPLLDLALNVTQRRRGMIGTYDAGGGFQVLATRDRAEPTSTMRVPDALLKEASHATGPYVTTYQSRGSSVERLAIPFGEQPRGLLLLEQPRDGAAHGQEVLRIAKAIGAVVAQRFAETGQRLQMRRELDDLRARTSLGSSPALASTRLQQVRGELREAARHRMPVMLIGEEGTEREDLARYLHAQSPEATAPFEAVHCAQLAPERCEAHLFHNDVERGGSLLRAHGGTLYCEQPELLPAHVQELLAAAVTQQRLAVAGAGEVPFSVRLIASCLPPGGNGMVGRLNELFVGRRLQVPPLRSDPRDVMTMIELALTRLGPCPGGGPRTVSERAKRLLQDYPWPGNLRELILVIESAAAKAGNGPVQPRHLPAELQNSEAADPGRVPSLEEIEKRHIRTTLDRVGGNRTRAAQLLGIATSTLYEKLKRFGIK